MYNLYNLIKPAGNSGRFVKDVQPQQFNTVKPAGNPKGPLAGMFAREVQPQQSNMVKPVGNSGRFTRTYNNHNPTQS